jgi:hypothetical protein
MVFQSMVAVLSVGDAQLWMRYGGLSSELPLRLARLQRIWHVVRMGMSSVRACGRRCVAVVCCGVLWCVVVCVQGRHRQQRVRAERQQRVRR